MVWREYLRSSAKRRTSRKLKSLKSLRTMKKKIKKKKADIILELTFVKYLRAYVDIFS